MRGYSSKLSVIFILFCMSLFTSCMSITDKTTPCSVLSGSSIDPSPQLQHAASLELLARDDQSLQDCISAYLDVLSVDPCNYKALISVANLSILQSTAYTSRRSEKKKLYRKAITATEQAMMTNPDFKVLIDQGEPVWVAARVLTSNEIDAIGFWATGIFYYFDECIPKSLKPFNLKWMRRAGTMLDYMEAIQPDWGGGMIYFSRGIYYMMPRSVGGDMEQSMANYEKAINVGPDWMLNRWGRARYLHQRLRDKEHFETDLNWVVSQDIQSTPGSFPWNYFFQQDAQRMLAEGI